MEAALQRYIHRVMGKF